MSLLGIRKTKTVYGWIKEKQIGTTRFGTNEIRFSAEQVGAFLRTDDHGVTKASLWKT